MAKGWRKKEDRLSAHERQAMPRADFALPGRGKGPKGSGSGSYPIEDKAHAKNALSRVSRYGSPAEKAEVRRKVASKYPEIGSGARAEHRYRSR